MQCTSTITALARVPPDPASRFGSLAASQHQSLSQTTHRHASGCRLRPAAGFAPSRRSQAPPGSLPCPLTGPSAACDAPTMRTAHRSWGVRHRPRHPRPAHHSDAHPGPNDSLGRSPGHTTPVDDPPCGCAPPGPRPIHATGNTYRRLSWPPCAAAGARSCRSSHQDSPCAATGCMGLGVCTT